MPAGFWGDDDLQAPPFDDQPAPDSDDLPGAPASDDAAEPFTTEPAADGSSDQEAPTAAPEGTAFAELQALFPGRIIEVIKHREAAAPPVEGDSDDRAEPDVDGEGYDDPDQAQLSFGPSD